MLKQRDWRRARGQAGDTIIEVMIVLAVLGMAIGISYSTANRSLLNARQAQEASLATEIVQAQTESLKALASGNDIYTTTPAFCITNSGSALTVSPLTAAQASAPLGASFPASCQMGEDNRYSIVITQPSAGTFSVKAYWDDIEGQGTDTATLNYRLPKVQPIVGGVEGGGGMGGGVAAGGCPANSTGYSDHTVVGGVTPNIYGNLITWGTGPYTDDSALGTAAVHAGLISVGQTATIRVCALPGQSSYGSSTKNGITTTSYGPWPGSITLIIPGS
jgi:prepilin-type N-terminal cleavage/methylation domain-containing protein